MPRNSSRASWIAQEPLLVDLHGLQDRPFDYAHTSLKNRMPTPGRCPRGSLAALVLLLSACAQPVPFEPVSIDSAGVQIVTTDLTRSDATCTFSEEPVLIIGENEEDVNQLFSSIRGMARLSDGSIAVADRAAAEVRIYDETGQHLRSMGRAGEAPGEFSNPFVLWITEGDTIWVGDYYPWSYNIFTAQGQLVRRMSLTPSFLNSPSAGGVLDNGYTVNARIVMARKEDFTSQDTMIVEVHDPGGELVGSLDRIPDRTSGMVREAENFWLYPLFQSMAEVDALGSTIVLAHGSEPELRVLDNEFNLRAIIRWFEPVRKVTSADRRAWHKDYVESRTRPANPQLRGFYDAMISRERPVADVFPVMSSVKIGRDGRVWVHRYNRPREDRGWLAFRADGEFMCHMAELPGDPWEFGADYVLLLHVSELGVQSVRMHRLTYLDTPVGALVSE